MLTYKITKQNDIQRRHEISKVVHNIYPFLQNHSIHEIQSNNKSLTQPPLIITDASSFLSLGDQKRY